MHIMLLSIFICTIICTIISWPHHYHLQPATSCASQFCASALSVSCWSACSNRVAQVAQSCKPACEEFSNLWGFLRIFVVWKGESEASHRRWKGCPQSSILNLQSSILSPQSSVLRNALKNLIYQPANTVSNVQNVLMYMGQVEFKWSLAGFKHRETALTSLYETLFFVLFFIVFLSLFFVFLTFCLFVLTSLWSNISRVSSLKSYFLGQSSRVAVSHDQG